jgi:hypothetical protein
MKELTLERNPMNVSNMGKPSVNMLQVHERRLLEKKP